MSEIDSYTVFITDLSDAKDGEWRYGVEAGVLMLLPEFKHNRGFIRIHTEFVIEGDTDETNS